MGRVTVDHNIEVQFYVDFEGWRDAVGGPRGRQREPRPDHYSADWTHLVSPFDLELNYVLIDEIKLDWLEK